MRFDLRSSEDGRRTPSAAIGRSAPTLRERLRHATRTLHDQVESQLDLERETWTLEAYRSLLIQLLDLHAPLEEALRRLDFRDCGLVIDDRLKRPWLEADLRDLGIVDPIPDDPADAADQPELDSLEAGMGAMYVLEGSTLGGQVILKALHQRLGVSADFGGRFYASYGPATGSMWRRYLEALERVGEAPAAADRIERAALETFQAFGRGLVAPADTTQLARRRYG